MSYATVTDMLTRFDAEELAQRADRGKPRLVDASMLSVLAAGGDMSGYTAPEQTACAAAVSIIQRAIDDAQNTVNGYISGRYSAPLADPPPLLNQVVCDIARFFLYDDQVTETIDHRYSSAIDWLKGVSNGKISIGPLPAGTEAPTGGAAEMSSTAPVWRREDSQGFI